jgi:exonuclease III
VRIVFWNIRAGGGGRVPRLLRWLARWEPDVVALGEFRATPPSAALAQGLAALGLAHQRTTADPRAPRDNRLLVAARWPLEPLASRPAPVLRGRWLLVRVAAPAPLALGAVHVPNRVSGFKYRFQECIVRSLGTRIHGPGVIVGDTNSGLPGVDEETPVFNRREAAFFTSLDGLGWCDAFRRLHGPIRAYTWYSPNGGNGFRIDQAFVNADLAPRVRAARYDWAARRGPSGGPSDHAAMLLDLAD